MPDKYSPQQRSRNMRAIRSANTKPELAVRKFLHANGLRYRLHLSSLPGRPDVVLKRHRTVIFVHGCFWHQHGCARSTLPKSRQSYWHPKLMRNVKRYERQVSELRKLGWRVITIWECQLDQSALRRRVRTLLGGKIK